MKVDYPITQSLDFFDNPYQVLDISKKLEYNNEGSIKRYPGARTPPVHTIDYNFYQYVCTKQLSIFYDYEEMQHIQYEADMYFQKITSKDTLKGEGWIHQDLFSQLTCLVYLTPNLTEIGTEIWTPKKEWDKFEEGGSQREYAFFRNEKIDEEEYLNANEKRQDLYEKVSSYNSIFNSCVQFDGSYNHSANLNVPEGEERITLITFFKNITNGGKAPIQRTGLA